MSKNHIWQGLRAAGRIHIPGLFATLALVAGVLAAPFSIAPAHAATDDLTCDFTATINFNPTLTANNTSATASLSATSLFNCISLNGQHSDLTSGDATGSGNATATGGVPCSLLLTISPFKGTVTWVTKEKSGFDATLSTNIVNNKTMVGITAKITSGPLKGDTVTAVPVEANPNPDCAMNGLKSLTLGVGLLVFG